MSCNESTESNHVTQIDMEMEKSSAKGQSSSVQAQKDLGQQQLAVWPASY